VFGLGAHQFSHRLTTVFGCVAPRVPC
jgi:hypothetical protein